MRKHHVFYSNGCDRLEGRIAPSAVAVAPAVQISRVDAHVQHAKVHHQPKVHHHVHPLPRQTVNHGNHQGGGTAGGGTGGGGTGGGGGYYGGGTGGGYYGGGYY